MTKTKTDEAGKPPLFDLEFILRHWISLLILPTGMISLAREGEDASVGFQPAAVFLIEEAPLTDERPGAPGEEPYVFETGEIGLSIKTSNGEELILDSALSLALEKEIRRIEKQGIAAGLIPCEGDKLIGFATRQKQSSLIQTAPFLKPQ